ncbi:hypothetical protein [Pedobacter frigiditerrae]|uniref:hypothetical protein n=1 Tax=Pedobacter frigiditerrae TaxID=2530452 RepID=UPI00292D6E7C|nr:hypothetical protein [Pedobacter frigiditerrae]
MKKLLIISAYFPPSNTADMQRVRMSLPYFKDFDWEVEVVIVDEKYSDVVKDPLLLESIPPHIVIHKVRALSKKWTSKFGLGSLGLRSMWFYKQKVNQLLKSKKFDLIYFSTTEFPICVLGNYWSRKFDIPYVIDMQDPWHSDYYKNKPKIERPKKYWFSYHLHKYLEPIAMSKVNGLISVSTKYIQVLHTRYPLLKKKPSATITFGAFDVDFEIEDKHKENLKLAYPQQEGYINLVYVGRGGYDMQDAINILFESFKKGIKERPELFNNVHLHFIGTSYAPKGKGIETISIFAQDLNISTYVTEYTDRIGFYETIKNLKQADGLIIIGSNDAAYTASKLYPYILTKKPLLAFFHQESSAAKIIKDCNAGDLITLDQSIQIAYPIMSQFIEKVNKKTAPLTNWQAFEPYTASYLTKQQINLFNQVIDARSKTI